jgi:hypothetical protein
MTACDVLGCPLPAVSGIVLGGMSWATCGCHEWCELAVAADREIFAHLFWLYEGWGAA